MPCLVGRVMKDDDKKQKRIKMATRRRHEETDKTTEKWSKVNQIEEMSAGRDRRLKRNI